MIREGDVVMVHVMCELMCHIRCAAAHLQINAYINVVAITTHFSMLKRTHGTSINIEVGINLNGCDPQATPLKHSSHGGDGHSLSETRDDSSRYYNVFHV